MIFLLDRRFGPVDIIRIVAEHYLFLFSQSVILDLPGTRQAAAHGLCLHQSYFVFLEVGLFMKI